MKQLAAVNDFVIRFANVNGSGSASANNLFAKAVFRMGVPVSPKNIFPSNIQGLPTWYEVRVNEAGHVGRRGGYDLVVAVNGQTLRQDYDGLEPGGYFLYDSSRPLPEDFQRDDLTLIGIPLTHLVNEAVANVRMRPLLKNILYVGALAALFDMDLAVLADSLRRQFEKNPKLAEPNIHALEIGHAYARGHFPDTCRLKVQQSDRVGDAIIMDGNTAAALGALYGGATVVGWYPITPSTSIIEAFGRYAGKYRVEADTGRLRVAIVQAEDELAAIGIVIGASWNGARLHRHLGRGRVAHDRVPRPGLLRRSAGGAHRCAAGGAVHRHAHPHPAVRPARLRPCLPRRHQTPAAPALRPARVL